MIILKEYVEDPSLFSQEDDILHNIIQRPPQPVQVYDLVQATRRMPTTTTTTTTSTDVDDNKLQSPPLLLNRRRVLLPSSSSSQQLNDMTTTYNPSIVMLLYDYSSLLLQVLKDLFLPLGYPHSVDESYVPYQLWDGLQGLCSYWRGVIATKAVLEATGVGNSEATAYSAAMQWAFRDGTGMMGGLLYSYLASSYLDTHPLEFRWLLADVINDVALTLDMLAPYYIEYSFIVLSFSTIGKTICGITAGATKGRITQHFAASAGNVADLTAKESTQETLVSLLGMIGGVLFAKLLEQHQDGDGGSSSTHLWSWILFVSLTLLHVWANYQAVKVIHLATLNAERTKCLFRPFVEAAAENMILTNQQPNQVQDDNDENKTNSKQKKDIVLKFLQEMSTPKNIQESFVSSIRDLIFPTIHVATSLVKVYSHLHYCTLWTTKEEIIEPSRGINNVEMLPYVLGITSHQKRHHIYIWLKVNATVQDEIQAYVHALLVQQVLQQLKSTTRTKQSDIVISMQSAVTQSTQWIQRLFQGNNSTNDILLSSSSSSSLLMTQLKEKCWDINQRQHSRTYLGFPSTRWSVQQSSLESKSKHI